MTHDQINLNDLAAKIAAALGPDWTISPHYDWACKLVHSCGQALFISSTRGPRGMLEISGTLPRSQQGYTGLRSNEHAASINVSLTKSPEQIARDITRRLLPTYHEQYARAKASVDASDAYEQQRDTINTAAQAMLDAYRQAHPPPTRHFLHLRHASASGVEVSLSDLTLPQLAAMLAVIN